MSNVLPFCPPEPPAPAGAARGFQPRRKPTRCYPVAAMVRQWELLRQLRGAGLHRARARAPAARVTAADHSGSCGARAGRVPALRRRRRRGRQAVAVGLEGRHARAEGRMRAKTKRATFKFRLLKFRQNPRTAPARPLALALCMEDIEHVYYTWGESDFERLKTSIAAMARVCDRVER